MSPAAAYLSEKVGYSPCMTRAPYRCSSDLTTCHLELPPCKPRITGRFPLSRRTQRPLEHSPTCALRALHHGFADSPRRRFRGACAVKRCPRPELLVVISRNRCSPRATCPDGRPAQGLPTMVCLSHILAQLFEALQPDADLEASSVSTASSQPSAVPSMPTVTRTTVNVPAPPASVAWTVSSLVRSPGPNIPTPPRDPW